MRLAILSLSAACLCAQSGASFSQAVAISPQQFFAGLKEVSLEIKADSSLAEFVSPAQQQAEVRKNLSARGISVNPGAPVHLAVTVEAPVYSVRTYDAGSSPDSGETLNIRGVWVTLRFFVRAGVLRGGKVRAVIASPMTAFAGSTLADDNGVRKFLFGEHTAENVRKQFAGNVASAFSNIGAPPGPTPNSWAVASWTAQQKAAADAEFAHAMAPGVPLDPNPFVGIPTPTLKLEPKADRDCYIDPAWRDKWSRAFERLRWTGSPDPSLVLRHEYNCVLSPLRPVYYGLLDQITLTDANVVYSFNGRIVRSESEISEAHHVALALENDAGDNGDERSRSFLGRNITDYLTDVALGNGGAPASVLSTPPPSVAPPPPPPDFLFRRFGEEVGRALGDVAATSGVSISVNSEAQAKMTMQKWVSDAARLYAATAPTAFDSWRNGYGDLISEGMRSWKSSTKPALAKGCWVVQKDNFGTFSCLLLEASDLNGLKVLYNVLIDDLAGSLPEGWKQGQKLIFGGDAVPSMGYLGSNGEHAEVWIASSGKTYELHFQVVGVKSH